MRRVFSGRPVAANIAECLVCPAADPRDRLGPALVDQPGAAEFHGAYRDIAGLHAGRVLCFAGAVQKKVVSVKVF